MCSDFVNYFTGYHRKHYMNVLIDIWIVNYLDIYALHFRISIFVLIVSFFFFSNIPGAKSALSLWEERKHPVCPPRSSLTLFPAGFEVQSLDPYAFETHFTAMQTKESGLQATRPVAVNRRFLSHSLFLSLTPFSQLASEKGRGEKAENQSLLLPCCFCLDWTERRRPATVTTIQSERPSPTQNSFYQVSWSHLKWHHSYSMMCWS